MKKIKLIIASILLFYDLIFSQRIDITIFPVISSTNYSSVNFNELLNYGIYNINNKTTKPVLNFGYGIKPGVNLELKYKSFILGGSFYISNSFTGPTPIAQRYNADGSEAHNYTLGKNHKILSKEKSKYRIIENENNIYFGYNPINNFTTNISFSNYTINVDKAHSANTQYPDSVKLDILEKINSLGITAQYKFNFLQGFNLYFNAGFNYIYNFKEIIYGYTSLETPSKYFNHNYDGIGYSLGVKFQWESIFVSYKYLQLQTEKNYFSNTSHKLELGISLEALSIDPDKLFGE